MPTYEFRCPSGHDFERFFKMSEAPSELACPECGQMAARRISGGAGLVFKGSGFYITDYGKDGKKDQHSRPAASGEGSKGAKSAGESGSDRSSSGSDAGGSGSGSTSAKGAGASSSSSAPTPAAKPSKPAGDA